MPRYVHSLIFMTALLVTAASAEDATNSPEVREMFRPAYFRWLEYERSRPEDKYSSEWHERRAAVIRSPGGAKETRHVYGWEVVTFVETGFIAFPFFVRPQEWDKSTYIYDGKLLFNQPDGSLTLIELESGKVIGRSRYYEHPYIDQVQSDQLAIRRIGAREWKRHGDVLNGGELLLDSETGDIIDRISKCSFITVGNEKRIVYRQYQEDIKKRLGIMDCETKEKTILLEDQSGIKFIVVGDHVICISYIWPAPERLQCFSLSEGALLWETQLPEKDFFPAHVSQDGLIYVFSRRLGDETYLQIHVYDMQGKWLETIPGTPDLFGGAIPDNFFKDYSFKNIEYPREDISYYTPPKIENGRLWDAADALRERYGLTVCPQAACQFSNGGVAWIECDPADNIPRLHYRDKALSWSGTMRTVDKLVALEAGRGNSTQFSIAGDENYIVYASNSGKMECLDRWTGQSRWIYVFPMLYVDDGSRSSWIRRDRFMIGAVRRYHDFFTDRAAFCDNELDTQGILPFHVDGGDETEQAVIIVDPSPDTGHRQNVWPAAIAAWGLPLAIAAALAATWRTKKRRLFKSMAYAALMLASVTTNAFLGGYSRYAHYLLVIDSWAALILLLFPVLWFFIRNRDSSDELQTYGNG